MSVPSDIRGAICFSRKGFRSPSAFDGGAGHAAGNLFPEDGTADVGGYNGQDDGSVQGNTVRGEPVDEAADTDLNGAELVRGDNPICKDELAPAGEE